MTKPITFLADTRHRLMQFPQGVRREAGFQLDRVQRGLMPADWKPMSIIGKGVNEIRIRGDDGAYRIIYIATLPEAIYVLHTFQKKSQTTAKKDLTLARVRLQSVTRSR